METGSSARDAGGGVSRRRLPVVRGLDRRADRQAGRTAKVKADIERSLRRPDAEPVVVAAYQMENHCGGESGKGANLERMLAAIEQAAREGARLLAFPEMCLQGYFTPVAGTIEEAKVANRGLADIPTESATVSRLREAAAKHRMVLVFGFAERNRSMVHNSAGVIDSDGKWLGVRRKNPLYPWNYETDCFTEPPSEQRSTVFDTSIGRIGVSICFDGEFAESVRHMRRSGARILVWINAACGDSKLGTAQRLNAAGAYAHGNGLWVVCVNCAAPNASGMTCIHPPEGEPLVVLSPGEEQLGIATIDLSMDTLWDRIWRDRVVDRVEPQTGR